MNATNGPWKLVQESVDPEWHIVTATGGRIMANVHIEAGNAVDAANARLVVAAPDLLAIVQRFNKAMEQRSYPELQGIACEATAALSKVAA